MKIILLTDGRIGSDNQSKALANEIAVMAGLEITHIPIEYNWLIHMPNYIRRKTLLGISKNSRSIVLQEPSIVIAAGRRLASVAAWLRKNHINTIWVQIMGCGYGAGMPDIYILPSHDNIKPSANNILTIGALTPTKQFSYREQPSRKIAVIVGGDSKHGKFTAATAVELGHLLSIYAKTKKMSLLISTSPRTSGIAADALENAINVDHVFYNYNQEKGANNPYNNFLSTADEIIVTGDSMSICSEAASIGKPVMIYATPTLCSIKHQRFIKTLCDDGYASLFDGKENSLPKENKILNETKRVAELVIDFNAKRNR